MTAALINFDLPIVFRCATELAEAVANVVPSEWESLPVDIEGRASPDFERWMDWHKRLGRIEQESTRLKRALGFTLPLTARDSPTDRTDGMDGERSAKWESYKEGFADTAHDRSVRLALVKLATAAIDLSGFATWRERQWQMRETGLRLLTWGLAQLWDGLTAEERSRVSDRLQRMRRALGWPREAASEAHPYDGPEDIPREDQYRIIDRSSYIACYRGYLNDLQKAASDSVREGQEKALRRATIPQVIDTADRAAQAIKAMAKRKFDTPSEWGELYKKALYSLDRLSRAKEISPFEDWPADAIDQRNLLAGAAELLLVCVGGSPEAKNALKPDDAEKAFAEFTKATSLLREIANRESAHQLEAADVLEDAAGGQDSTRQSEADGETEKSNAPPATKKSKRSTERGEGRAKIIAALNTHHQYDNGSCKNLVPIGNNELAHNVGVSESSVSRFFKKDFNGHSKYRAACNNTSSLVFALKLLNGEISPRILSDAAQLRDRIHDDE